MFELSTLESVLLLDCWSGLKYELITAAVLLSSLRAAQQQQQQSFCQILEMTPTAGKNQRLLVCKTGSHNLNRVESMEKYVKYSNPGGLNFLNLTNLCSWKVCRD